MRKLWNYDFFMWIIRQFQVRLGVRPTPFQFLWSLTTENKAKVYMDVEWHTGLCFTSISLHITLEGEGLISLSARKDCWTDRKACLTAGPTKAKTVCESAQLCLEMHSCLIKTGRPFLRLTPAFSSSPMMPSVKHSWLYHTADWECVVFRISLRFSPSFFFLR